MELELNRVDYTLVGLTNPKSLKLLPPSTPKTAQKVAIGDQDGVLHVFAVKKGEIQTILKTPPGPKISRLELGGALGYPRDKIFISLENEVKGFTKKGKQFLGFDTNLTEPIKSMYVEGSDLLVCGQHNFNHYQDCKDANSFVCADVINDVVALNALKTNRLTPILACDDRVLRVLDHSHVLHAVSITGSPTVLHLHQNDGGDSGDQILYGTSNGGVGMLQIGRKMKNYWLIEPDETKGEITCLDCYDMTGDGSNELIVGRGDGNIEVYTIPPDSETSPKQIYSYTCNETVTSVVCGVVGNNGYDEIVVSTYSGWVFGLTTEVLGKTVSVSTDANNMRLSQEAKQKMLRLRNEIEELEEKISKERERYQMILQDNEFAVSAIPFVAINDKVAYEFLERFYLNKDDASYTLCLEVQTSIDNVLIQSDVPVDLLDVEKNSAVVSFSDCESQDGNFLLATYRCQLNTTRLDLKIRTIEGQYGILQTYVTPNIQPKCCQVRQYRIKPLSLHTRSHEFDPKRPYNTLTLKGGFSMAEMHAWIEYCLPEVPEKPPPGETGTLIFTSTFLDTMLQCSYGKGEAEFKSDNISTISILKDVLSKEAIRSNKKRNLDITWSINDESITHTLNLLRPKLEHQLELLRKMTILESMTELDITEIQNDSTLLTDEYLEIIKNEKEVVEEYKRQPAYLDRLYGMITDLFIDKYKFQGINVKGKISKLLELLEREKYSYNELINFFHQ